MAQWGGEWGNFPDKIGVHHGVWSMLLVCLLLFSTGFGSNSLWSMRFNLSLRFSVDLGKVT